MIWARGSGSSTSFGLIWMSLSPKIRLEEREGEGEGEGEGEWEEGSKKQRVRSA